MINKKIKRIVAKQGLVIISLVTIGGGLIFLGDQIYSRAHLKLLELKLKYNLEYTYSSELKEWLAGISNKNDPSEYTEEENRVEGIGFHLVERQDLGRNIQRWAFYILVFGYPFYLLLLFVIWSVKTLRDEME